MTERRTQTSAFMSPTAPTSLNASRTNLAADIVNEEDEDDGHNAADRVTLGSSRVSISSAFSGFEPSMTHGSDVPDHETLANTHYNNRSSASFFGSSLPSTPTTEKVFEKAKGLFHLMRARSPTHTAHAESEARAAPDYEKSDPPANSGADLAFPPPPPMVAAASSQDKHAVLNLAQAASTARVPAVEADPGGNPPQSERPNDMDSGLDGTRKQSLEVPDRNKVASTDSIRPTTPLYSPRPRLKSMRSANTVLSVSSFGLGKSASSIGQEQSVQDVTEDATYDTSSKKRVQSWTDRILFKSNIVIEDNAGHSTMHRSLLSGTFLPSFRITGRNAHEHQVDLNRISSRIGALAGEFQDRSSSLHKSDAAASNEQGAMYKRQNSSTSSLPGSQQRLNGRIAGLFRRRSSDKRSISSQLYSNGGALDNTKDFDRQDLNLKAEPAALTPGVRQSSHADSEQPTHHDSSGQLGANPTDQAPRPPSSDQTNPAIHVGKVKPHRAFTSPLPEGRVEALSHGAETLHPDAASRDRSYVESSDDQSAGVTSPLSAHTLSAQAVASGEMLRHGSEPLRSTLPSRVHSSPDETTSPYVDSVANQSRRSSARGNPFSRSYYKDQVPLAPLASGALAGGDKTSRPAKTGITILPSQTTPVTSDTHQTEEKPHARLRHWWNARMLPHIFPFHSEAHVSEDGPSAQPVIPGASNDVPEPRVVGPRRGEVQCIYYDSVSDLRRMEACSDHRPVVAVFAIGV